jgi:hypothetical protein
MSAQKKKTVQLVEVDEIDEDPTPPAPKVRSRSKPKAIAPQARDLQAAIVETRRELFRVYETQRGVSRNGLLRQLTNEPAFLFLDASMTHYFIAYRDADTDEERLEILRSGPRFFRKIAKQMQNGPAIERRREFDQENGLAICFGLADPSVETRHWKGRPRVSELFPLEAELDHREELKEARARAAKAAPKMPVFVEKGSIPIMPGQHIDGLPARHPMNAPQQKPKTTRLLTPEERARYQGLNSKKPPIMNNSDIVEDAGGQRTLRDASGLIQNPRVNSGVFKW